MFPRVIAAILISVVTVNAEDDPEIPISRNISISDPQFSISGNLEARLTNETDKEIRIHPSSCEIETRIDGEIVAIRAVHPNFISLISLKIPAGESRMFSFDLVPGVAKLDGEIRLLVYWVDPVETRILSARSEPFSVAEVKSAPIPENDGSEQDEALKP
ncbi:MAG: hypothetical protein MI807_17930 [Verrucomicrobiales bacterium]|nr:hypothetical protein [Verrucomicrobiales bacterium]